jgi:polyisoprenoid-binding protein YceI
MKSIILIIIAIVVIVFVGYKLNSSSQKASPLTTPEDTASSTTTPTADISGPAITGTFTINTGSSTATWTGSKKLIVNYFDSGSINVKSGDITVDAGIIKSGKVVFNMNSITAKTTGKGDGQDMLTKHLKSPDFFDTTKYPEATYTAASTTKNNDGTYVLHGSLTVKGKTHPLDVPATVGAIKNMIVLFGTAEVDRTKWDVRYGSDSFFKNLGNNVINDTFTLKFEVVAPVGVAPSTAKPASI